MVDFAGFLVQAVAFVAQVVVAAADENARMVVFSAAFVRFPLRLKKVVNFAINEEFCESTSQASRFLQPLVSIRLPFSRRSKVMQL